MLLKNSRPNASMSFFWQIKIAEMLEVSVQTVNYHIAYAIEALSKSLKIASPKKK